MSTKAIPQVGRCLPSNSWVHVRCDMPNAEHWGICETHKIRWRIGYHLTEPPRDAILDGPEREKFFNEYQEGHCPGYGRTGRAA